MYFYVKFARIIRKNCPCIKAYVMTKGGKVSNYVISSSFQKYLKRKYFFFQNTVMYHLDCLRVGR